MSENSIIRVSRTNSKSILDKETMCDNSKTDHSSPTTEQRERRIIRGSRPNSESTSTIDTETMCDNSTTDHSSPTKEQRESRFVRMQVEVESNKIQTMPQYGANDMKWLKPNEALTTKTSIAKASKLTYSSSESDSGEESVATPTNDRKRAKLTSENYSSDESSDQGSASNLIITSGIGKLNASSSDATFNSKVRKPSKSSNVNHFTREDRSRADEAEELHVFYCHPSDSRLGKSLDSNLIPNSKLTSRDVRNNRLLRGTCSQCNAGKDKKKSIKPSKTSQAKSIGDVLSMDLDELADVTPNANKQQITCVDEKKKEVVDIVESKSKSADYLFDAVWPIVCTYNTLGFKISTCKLTIST